jgi:hypothetical protein
MERWQILTKSQYDPFKHLTLGTGLCEGLFSWSHHAPDALIQETAEYFAMREEDATLDDEPPSASGGVSKAGTKTAVAAGKSQPNSHSTQSAAGTKAAPETKSTSSAGAKSQSGSKRAPMAQAAAPKGKPVNTSSGGHEGNAGKDSPDDSDFSATLIVIAANAGDNGNSDSNQHQDAPETNNSSEQPDASQDKLAGEPETLQCDPPAEPENLQEDPMADGERPDHCEQPSEGDGSAHHNHHHHHHHNHHHHDQNSDAAAPSTHHEPSWTAPVSDTHYMY